MLGVLLLGLAFLRRSDELGKVTLGAFALLGAVSVVVFLTGEPAEELVEKLPGFSEALTERHEEAALVATIAMGVVGFLSVIGLAVFRAKQLARWVVPTAFVFALAATAAMAYAANLGGQIRHTEIRPAAVPTAGENGRDTERGERGER